MARKKREKTAFTQQFSEKFKNYVKKQTNAGITREEVAAGIGITPSQLFNIENDLATPTVDTLHKICKYFDVSADYLLGLSSAETLTGDIKIAEHTTGLSRKAVNQLSALSKLFQRKSKVNIVSAVIGSDKFLNLVAQIDFVTHLAEESQSLPHSGNGTWNFDGFDLELGSIKEEIETASWEKDLSEKLGYPVYVITPDQRFSGELAAVREIAGNLANEIVKKRLDVIYSKKENRKKKKTAPGAGDAESGQ